MDRHPETIQTRITSQGQVSIPARIRRKLGLTPGSTVEWCERGPEVLVRRATKYSSLEIHQAVFPATPERKSVEEMDTGIGIHLRRRHERSLIIETARKAGHRPVGTFDRRLSR